MNYLAWPKWAASYTVGPQMYHFKVFPFFGTKGTWTRVNYATKLWHMQGIWTLERVKLLKTFTLPWPSGWRQGGCFTEVSELILIWMLRKGWRGDKPRTLGKIEKCDPVCGIALERSIHKDVRKKNKVILRTRDNVKNGKYYRTNNQICIAWNRKRRRWKVSKLFLDTVRGRTHKAAHQGSGWHLVVLILLAEYL